jgi:radical SAM superfamily enzyme YgiQ (UPF0313 family)
MSSRVLLISANRCTTPDPVFPLGLAYLNSALRRAGHQTHWVDLLGSSGRLEEALSWFRPNVVGVSLRNIDDVLIRKKETYYGELLSLSETIRQYGRCRFVLGGSGFSLFPKRLLELSGADFGIIGEGEGSLVALLAALEKGEDYRQVPGLVYRLEETVLVNGRAGARSPDCDFSLADRPADVIAHYIRATGVLNVQTQRGCGWRCSYCTYPVIEGRQHRRRAPDQVAAEFLQLQRLGAKYVFIVDSIFNSSAAHVRDICEALLRHNVKLPWGCFLRPQGLTPELVDLMARAGLRHIEFGSDSFSDEVLAAYQKGFTFEDILRSSNLARRAGVDFCHFLICGGPGETTETLRQTHRNSLQIEGAPIVAVVGMRIYPGTDLFERARREGQVNGETDLLAPSYYLAKGLTPENVFVELEEFARQSPNWIVGDPSPAYTRMVERLRQRGVPGPLWSYFAAMQRIRPAHLVEAHR